MLLSLTLVEGNFNAAHAQQTEAALQMSASQYQLSRLAAGATVDQATFSIDRSNLVNVEIIAAVGGITTSVIGPTGQVISPDTVEGIGGTFNDISGTTTPTGPSLFSSLTANHHYVY